MSGTSPASPPARVNKLNLANDHPMSSSRGTEPSELVAVVDDLLNSLTSKFNNISSEMLGKLDEMSKRLDALETQIQAGNGNPPGSSAASSTSHDVGGAGGGEE